MGMETIETAADPLDHYIGMAKDWSEGKTAKQMAIEVFTMELRILAVLEKLCNRAGLDIDGNPLAPVQSASPVQSAQ